MSLNRQMFFLPAMALVLSNALPSSLVSQSANAQAALSVASVTPHADPVWAAAAGSRAPVIRKNVDLVLVPVTVTDDRERLVRGLGRGNFSVFDGKRMQQIKHFSSEDAPVSLGIIVDTSGSMKDKIERAREAVSQFCQAANLQDEFFLITFADQPHLLTDFTRPEEVEQQLLFARTSGQTALLDAVYMGLGKMRGAKYSRKALLLISDGGDNHSRYSEHEVLLAVKEADVMIYALGTFDRHAPTQEELLGPFLLSGMAEVTGGRAFVLENANDMPALAHRIGAELRLQYVLGYRPQEIRQDGKWHKINVKLIVPKHLSFFRVHARTGYYAAEP